MNSKSLLTPYQTGWPKSFKLIRRELNNTLADFNHEVVHVGSTSVPGLAAKPIIDIDLVYNHHSQFDQIIKKLDTIGYIHVGDQGITGREVCKRSNAQIKHTVLDHIPHHLYICHKENREFKRHQAFRDFLSINRAARERYERLKLDIAEKANQDKKVYASMKEQLAKGFIESILKEAPEN